MLKSASSTLRRGAVSAVDNRPCPDCDGTGDVPQHGAAEELLALWWARMAAAEAIAERQFLKK
jgi:hypothetical protein